MDALEKRGEGNVEAQRRDVEEQKRATTARETSYGQRSADSRNAAKQELDNTIANQPRACADRNRSKLAHEYPEGVTEESYTEGNKVIIRRVVVKRQQGRRIQQGDREVGDVLLQERPKHH